MADSTFSIRVEGLDEFQKNLNGVPSNMKMYLTRAMVVSTQKIKGAIQQNITNKGITNTGTLAGSVTVIEATDSRGIVGVGERYGGAVEFGRKPGKMPPVAPIERWAQTKLGTPGLGFLIARKIGRKGTDPQPFVEPAFEENKEFVQRQFEDVANRIVLDLAR